VLDPADDAELVRYGCGLTNLVARATAGARALRDDELRTGALRVEETVHRWAPRCLAVLGIGAFRTAFRHPRASLGRQVATLGDALVWVLPNPSGLNARHQLDDLGERFAELCLAVRRS